MKKEIQGTYKGVPLAFVDFSNVQGNSTEEELVEDCKVQAQGTIPIVLKQLGLEDFDEGEVKTLLYENSKFVREV